MSKTVNEPYVQLRTLNLQEASDALGAKKETVRRLAASGKIPGVKVGRGWRFLEHDLVSYFRSQYSNDVTLQGAVLEKRSSNKWRYTNEAKHGGLALHTEDKEYRELLGQPSAKRPASSTTS